MHISLKVFGARLRQIFGDPAKLPVGWNLIDRFATLEEREVPLPSADEAAPDGAEVPATPNARAGDEEAERDG